MRVRQAVLAALLLAACTPSPSPRRIAAMQAFVGQSEVTVVQAMGVPTRSFEADGHRFLAYDERRVVLMTPAPGPGWWGPPYMWQSTPPYAYETGCETTFDVVSGIVRAFSLRGPDCR
jgi:hypothetical protein